MQKSVKDSLIFKSLRFICGWIVASAFWWLWGYLVAGMSLAFAMAIWCFIAGPVFFQFMLLIRRPFFSRSMYRVDLRRFPALMRAHFKNIIQLPGPNPKLFLLPSGDATLIWLQSLWSKKQEIYVGSTWLEQDPEDIEAQWLQVWKWIVSLKHSERVLRTIQWSVWCACLLPLDLALHFLDLCFSFFGFKGLPKSAFWAQRVCWSLKRIWLGPESGGEDVLFQLTQQKTIVNSTPQTFESLLWGVWCSHAPKGVHPSWVIWMDSRAFFMPRQRQVTHSEKFE